jgi:3-methyladenine DNA glycosylase AlkD
MNQTILTTEITDALLELADPDRAVQMAGFFKTGPGEYGAGDIFLGISVPQQRAVAGRYKHVIEVDTVRQLLDSEFHEVRLTAVFLLNLGFHRDDKTGNGRKWVDLYMSKTDRINNWDLVDSSAHIVLGRWLEKRERDILYRLAESSLLWDNRIAMVATLHFIRQGDLGDCLQLAEKFLDHPHDLMHKASGWMLREAWKRDAGQVEDFLNKYADIMPRTMLRYAIEKMEEPVRRAYLGRDVRQ